MKKVLFILFFIGSIGVFAQKGGIAPINDCIDAAPGSIQWYRDADNDGFGNPSLTVCSINQPLGYVSNYSDCDDTNASITNGTMYYPDNDGDGFGAALGFLRCIQPNGYVTNNLDCDDSDPNITTSSTPWYADLDNDGFGDPINSILACIPPNGYVSNNLDQCPTVYGTVNGCPTGGGTSENMNWIISKTYDIEGGITSNSKAYFDELGKNLQVQTVDIKTGNTWASQTLYDSQGRPALQSLSAPINNTGQFLYNLDFIKKSSGATYTTSDFETSPENPATVGNQVNSLGWYYSESNTNEPYQDITSYPFSRSIYSSLNPGSTLKVIGGNKVDRGNGEEWLSGFSYTVPAAQELYYAFGKGYFGTPDIIEAQEEVITKFFKTVSINVHGEESVVFTDGEGKVLAAARSGGNTKYEVVSTIGEQGFVDIHIPKGILNSDIQLLGNISDYIIYDLRTEQPINSSQMTGGNFYRVEYLYAITNTQSFINSNGSVTSGTGAKGIQYKVNYYDYTLNYYDEAGRLVETTQPLGFDTNSFDLTIEVPDHKMKSTFKYSALGQLLETSSPDEGTTQFQYREDGQIRFSQSSKQAINNEFSYTNYDDLGRPIESGVYNGPQSFGTAVSKGVDLVDLVKVKVEGNRITKIAGEAWDAGTATVDMISGDGYIQWRFPYTDKRVMAGLSPNNTNSNYNTIKYAFYAYNNDIFVYESGSNKASLGTYSETDIFKIERIGNIIYYKKNNVVLYTSTISSSGNLLGDFSFLSPDSKVTDFIMGGSVITPTLDPYTNYRNVIVSGNTITANAGVDTSWDAGINTLETISTDGSMQWRATQNNKYLMVGLSPFVNVNSAAYGYTKYTIYMHGNGNFYVYEFGNWIGSFGAYNTNDIFKIERIGNMVQYLHNGIVFYTSTLPSYNEELAGDVSIKSLNASISDITFTGGQKKFKDLVQVTFLGNEIRKSGPMGWSSGFASSNTINGDGYVKFKAPKNTLQVMVGLSDSNINHVYNTIDYALYANRNQNIVVYESGVYKGSKGPYEPGDILKVERVGNTIRYYRNEDVVYTSTTTTTAPLLIDASFLDPETYIEDLGFYDIVDAVSTVNINDTLDSNYCKEQQFTVYDEAQLTELYTALGAEGIPTSYYPTQNFVAGNVSQTYTQNPNTAKTWYSYDIYGRVEWMVQEIDGLGTKTIDYEYDPIKGQVTKVIYQKHKPSELFAHQYTYNTVGQLTQVATSTNNLSFSTQAQYKYYETGALKRTILGANVQGIDYVYNLAGQLKAINHPSLNSTNDPGGDSNDAFGMQIDYYSGDYARTNTPKPITTSPQGTNRYDGNIKATRWAINGLDATPNTFHNAYTYEYDSNNWLKEAAYGTTTNSATITPNVAADYKVSNLTYDANGNLLSLTRNKHTENSNNQMDNFTYNYNGLTNQLNYVSDAVTSATNAADLKSQGIDNYEYNSIGQLIKDKDKSYTYNASGLVTSVSYDYQYVYDPNNPPAPGNPDWTVNFYYNDRGQRVRKEDIRYVGPLGEQSVTETYYVRDASGSVMSIYQGTYGLVTQNPVVEEQPIYGLSRIGMFNRPANTNNFEVTDHLGNVRAVVSSSAAITNYSDYYPFGMPMPNRNLEGNYRYKYQGQEKDPETGKEAFELRLWDSRIGRWLTTDPARQYASPYLGMGNNPINGIDSDGAFWEELGNWLAGNGWNSNTALEFQANGGTLGEWYGSKFTGYRRGTFSPEEGGAGVAAFRAKDDFWNYDAFNFQGRVAIGQLNQISGDIDNMFGIGGAVNWSKVNFLGGKYGNYWYTYVGLEGGFNSGLSEGASVDVSTEFFIAIYQKESENSPNPLTFEGSYSSTALNVEAHALAGISGFISKTNSGDWRLYSIGIGGGIGGNLKASLEGRIGVSKLTTPKIAPTNKRGIWDIISNKLIHSTLIY